ncbi:hypothetical protein JYU34_004639 [Plutella xylostella]|uniref:Uncharacterized protein n=2 Tax=Plutella xylostella TaxID=51655 RepID=A0ABQ7QYI0_PLUXY|nr:hypothetical protein JYU34_004639 [Plutella xylostella]CAG9120942.1 unnamed protein product [Plutella xylostella]
MIREENILGALGKTSNYVKKTDKDEVEAEVSEATPKEEDNSTQKRNHDKRISIPKRIRRISVLLTPNLRKLRKNLKELTCVKKDHLLDDSCDDAYGMDDKDLIMEVTRHRSLDRGSTLRRASQFIFTRKSASEHPYHPFTPKTTVRKMHFIHFDDH